MKKTTKKTWKRGSKWVGPHVKHDEGTRGYWRMHKRLYKKRLAAEGRLLHSLQGLFAALEAFTPDRRPQIIDVLTALVQANTR